MDALIPLVSIVGFIAVFVGVIVFFARWARKREKDRTHGLKSSATLLSWQFVEEATLDHLPNLDRFALFSEGHSKAIKNLMQGEINGVKAALFDYTFVVGHGKHQHTVYQSVVYFESSDLNLPSFSLRPENALHKLIAAFGYQDIDFGNRPTFSTKYLLRGTDEQGIRHTFNDALLAFFETNPGQSTDGGGNQLFIFRQGYRVPPHEAQSFIHRGSQLQGLFSQ